ncbi:unnamed protein product, partial [Effrenium voratum]
MGRLWFGLIFLGLGPSFVELTQQLLHFAKDRQVTQKELEAKQLLLRRVKGVANRICKLQGRDGGGFRMQVTPFGSSVTGCGESGADVDAVLHANVSMGKRKCLKFLQMLRGLLRKQGVQVIGPVGHRVPILKLQLNGLDCDLSCGNLLPLLNTQLLRLYAELMPQMAVLCILVKRWAKTQGIGSVMTGGLSSYAWTLMVVYYLQVTHSLDSLHQLCEEEASLLFYAEDFDWQNELVSVRRGCFSVREESMVTWRDGLINIEDPVEITRNLNFALSDHTPHQLPDAFWAAGERLDRGGLEALLELPVPAAGGRFSLPFRRLPFHLRPATLRKLRAQLEAEATEVTGKAAGTTNRRRQRSARRKAAE